MNRLSNKKLLSIEGGATNTISGTVINAFTNIIKLLLEAGEGVGSSLRRIKDNRMCPLE